MPSRYTWTATYDDGTTLEEIHPSGDAARDAGFLDVDHTRLAGLTLAAVDGSETPVMVHLPTTGNPRGIFFRRNARGVFGDPSGSGLNMTCIGYQQTINGTNVRTMLWLTDDGRILLTDRDLQEMT